MHHVRQFVAKSIHSIDKQVVSRCTAPARVVAVVKEGAYPFSHSGPFYGHAFQKNVASGQNSRSFLEASASWTVDKTSMARPWGLVSQGDLVHDPKGQHLIYNKKGSGKVRIRGPHYTWFNYFGRNQHYTHSVTNPDNRRLKRSFMHPPSPVQRTKIIAIIQSICSKLVGEMTAEYLA